jgi:hypothetical protein
MRRSWKRSRRDYPDGVIGVYDNGGKTVDRYTVVYTPEVIDNQWWYTVLGMSEAPFHPQGVGQHSQYPYRPNMTWGGCGDRCIAFEELPADCQRAVRNDLAFQDGE